MPDGFYKSLSSNWIIFLATLWALAYVEELVWNRGVWHEKNWLFGANWNLDDWKMYLVPLARRAAIDALHSRRLYLETEK